MPGSDENIDLGGLAGDEEIDFYMPDLETDDGGSKVSLVPRTTQAQAQRMLDLVAPSDEEKTALAAEFKKVAPRFTGDLDHLSEHAYFEGDPAFDTLPDEQKLLLLGVTIGCRDGNLIAELIAKAEGNHDEAMAERATIIDQLKELEVGLIRLRALQSATELDERNAHILRLEVDEASQRLNTFTHFATGEINGTYTHVQIGNRRIPVGRLAELVRWEGVEVPHPKDVLVDHIRKMEAEQKIT